MKPKNLFEVRAYCSIYKIIRTHDGITLMISVHDAMNYYAFGFGNFGIRMQFCLFRYANQGSVFGKHV
jgi:hypothetical protein